jgi:hypothetical protein
MNGVEGGRGDESACAWSAALIFILNDSKY